MKQILSIIACALVGVGAYFLFLHDPNGAANAAAMKLSAPTEITSDHVLTVSDTVTETADTEEPAAKADDPEQVDAADALLIPDMMIGNPDAPITVIEYASFTCPHCAAFHKDTFKDLKRDYIDTGKINFIYREVYFDRYGLWASMIARCAGPEKFFGMTNLIFNGQSTWARAGEPAAIIDELRKIGRLAGLDNEALEVCLANNDKAKALVAWYQEKAGADEIDSTPSFIINGKKYSNMSFAEMSEILDTEQE